VFSLVFDMHLPNHEPVFGNPSFLEYGHFAPVVIDNAPSAPLLSVLMFIGTLCFPADLFSEDDVTCLGLLAAGFAFLRRWNDVSVLGDGIALPGNFEALWEPLAALGDTSGITQAIKAVRGCECNNVKNVWNAFLDQLSHFTGIGFDAVKRDVFEDLDDDAVMALESSSNLKLFAIEPPRK
jgi:hypothetical protein